MPSRDGLRHWMSSYLCNPYRYECISRRLLLDVCANRFAAFNRPANREDTGSMDRECI